MIRTILFDIDGTLIDTEEANIKSLQKTLVEKKGLDKTPAELEFTLGIPGLAALKKFSDLPVERQALLDTWNDNFQEFFDTAHIFAGIQPVLQHLAETPIQLGVVTSQLDTELARQFTPFGLNHYFDMIVTASQTKKHKPDPDPVLHALRVLDAQAGSTLYIGDAPYDMQSAHTAKTQFGLAKWGARDLQAFAQAEYLFDTPDDIVRLVG